MTQLKEIMLEIESIRDQIADAPDLGTYSRRKFTIDRLEKFFDDCDVVNDAVDSVFGRLDDLVIKIGEMK